MVDVLGLWDWVLGLTIVLSDDDSDNLRYIRIKATRNILNVIDIFCNIFNFTRGGGASLKPIALSELELLSIFQIVFQLPLFLLEE